MDLPRACNQNRIALSDEILNFATAEGGVCSKDEIGDRFRRKHGQDGVDAALKRLKQEEKVICVMVKTGGRDREVWHFPKPS